MVVFFFGFLKISLAYIFSLKKMCKGMTMPRYIIQAIHWNLFDLNPYSKLLNIIGVPITFTFSFQKRKIYFVRGLSLLSTSFTDHVINYSFADIHGKSWTKPDSQDIHLCPKQYTESHAIRNALKKEANNHILQT